MIKFKLEFYSNLLAGLPAKFLACGWFYVKQGFVYSETLTFNKCLICLLIQLSFEGYFIFLLVKHDYVWKFSKYVKPLDLVNAWETNDLLVI